MNPEELFEKEIILEDGRARLEPLSRSHYEPLEQVALSNRDIWKFTLANILDKASFTNYFNIAMEERTQRSSYPFAMFDKSENRYVGCTRFANISFRDKRLEIGWTWIDPLLQGSGINKHNKFLMLRFAFEELGFNRVELKTAGTNLKSQRAMEKIGAVREGVLRKHSINDIGTIRDTVYYSFINDEWPAIKETIFSEFITAK